MRLHRECFCLSLFKLQFILGKIIQRTLHQESTLEIFETVVSSDWESIGSSFFGKGQPCFLTRQFCLRLQKTMSFPIQYCVWVESVQVPSKHGRERLIGLWIHVNLENWIECGQIFTGFTTLEILNEIQKMMTESKCEPEQFKGRSIFMSMYNDSEWGQRGNRENWIFFGFRVCPKIRARTLVVSWALIREEMVRNPRQQTR